MLNFELRQYDPRIGRWNNPDPYGQHHSPYLAMSNNPISSIDPDGGWDTDDPNGGRQSLYDRYTNKYNSDAYSHSQFDNNYQHGGASGGSMGADGSFYSNDEQIYDAQINNLEYNHSTEYYKDANGDFAGAYTTFGKFYGVDGNGKDIIKDGVAGWAEIKEYTQDEIFAKYGINKKEWQKAYKNSQRSGVPVQDIDLGESGQRAEVWRNYGRNFNDLADASEKAIIYTGVVAGAVITGGAVAEAYGLYAGGATIVAETKILPKLLTQTFTKFPRLATKFAEHGKDFTSAGINGFYKRAVSLANSKPGGNILGFTSKEGWVFRMNARTGEFTTIRPNGEIATFFRRVQEPMKYWAEQIKLYGN